MDTSDLPTNTKSKQHTQIENNKNMVIKAEPQDVNMSGFDAVGDESISIPQGSALDNSSYENDMGEFLGGLSEDVVMSLPGSPHKPYRKYIGETDKRICKSWYGSAPSRQQYTVLTASSI